MSCTLEHLHLNLHPSPTFETCNVFNDYKVNQVQLTAYFTYHFDGLLYYLAKKGEMTNKQQRNLEKATTVFSWY